MQGLAHLELPLLGEVFCLEGETGDTNAIWAVFANPRLALAARERMRQTYRKTRFEVTNWFAGTVDDLKVRPTTVFAVTNNAPGEQTVRIIAATLQMAEELQQNIDWHKGDTCSRIECWRVQGDAEAIDRAAWP